VEIGCVVPCDIIWLPRLLYCPVLVAKPFEVVSLQGNDSCATKIGDIYCQIVCLLLPSSIPFWETLGTSRVLTGYLACLSGNGLESGSMIREHRFSLCQR
jgi:hypothetical protein